MSHAAEATTLHGFLNVCKAPGFTSHDVVAVTRRLLDTRRIGHAGTLDPLAEGVLPLCIGRATHLVERVAAASKGYYAEIVLGVRTETDDAEGDVIDTVPVPPLDWTALEAALGQFQGEVLQRPPAFSAVKVAGRRAYQLARRGEVVQLRERSVTIDRITLHRWESPRLAVTIACSKGTYIRSIARDLGAALGCGAHLARLVRTWVSGFSLADAVSLDEVAQAAREGRLAGVLTSVDVAVSDLAAAIVDPARAIDLHHGRGWPQIRERERDPTRDEDVLTRVYNPGGTLLGLAAADHQRSAWQPKLAFSSLVPEDA